MGATTATLVSGVIIGLYVTITRLCEHRLRAKFDIRVITILILLVPLAVYLGPWAVATYIPLSTIPFYETVRAAVSKDKKAVKVKKKEKVKKMPLTYDRMFMIEFVKKAIAQVPSLSQKEGGVPNGGNKEDIGRAEEGIEDSVRSLEGDTSNSGEESQREEVVKID
jgi:type III secretory pathway component EscS